MSQTIKDGRFLLLVATTLTATLFIGSFAEALNTHSVDFERGSSQYLLVSDGSQAGLDITNVMTVEAWVKLESFGSGEFHAVVAKDNGQPKRSYAFSLLNAFGTHKACMYNSLDGTNTNTTSNVCVNAGTLSLETWHHVAWVFNAADGEVEVFVNGISQGTADGLNTSSYDSTATFTIGSMDGTGTSYFDGMIDEVRVWDVVRTPEEIAANMSHELEGNEPGLVGYWTFNGSSLEDATTNNNDLTNVNGALFSADTPFTGEHEINPVIVVPGLLGSAEQKGVWVIDPILHTYDDLVSTLDQNGYTPDVDLFTFAYDWRNSNVTTAGQLKQKIDAVKGICGCERVDLVAHSMGGLVARQYMQSAGYEGDVDQVIFLGTPHRGAPKAYAMWEGGAFVTPSVFDRLTQRFLSGDARKQGYSSVFTYLHEHPVASVSELLPDYGYLFDAGALRTYPAGYPANTFLTSLNAGVQTLLDSGSALYSFVSDDFDTITGFDVVSAPGKAPLWTHGYPEDFDNTQTDRGIVLGAGDQTVPYTSASFVNENLTSMDSKHNGLPEDSAGEIVEILRGEPATTVVDTWNVPNIKVLMFQMFSPADMLVTDPSGKRIGTVNGTDVNEIPGAFYAGPTAEREIITIPNPKLGKYTIQVRGTGKGSFTLETSYLTDTGEDVLSRSSVTASGKTSVYSVDVQDDADAVEIVATIASTLLDIEYAYTSRWIDTATYHSLKGKLSSAQLFEKKSKIAKQAILKSALDEIQKRRKSIAPEAYEMLTEDIRSLLAQ